MSLSRFFGLYWPLPFPSLDGNTVPLHSPAFRRWLTHAFAQNGYFPNPSQYGAVVRRLDEDARLHPAIHPVNIRSATIKPNTYRLDLANRENEAIEINGKQWSTTHNPDSRFRRPQASIPFPKPKETKAQIHKFLELIFNISEPVAQTLVNWLVAAMLPDLKPPILVITGTARNDAAAKLRNLLDPAMCPLNAQPVFASHYKQLAITNKALAFSFGTILSKSHRDALRLLSTGVQVRLPEAPKGLDLAQENVHRPIIVSAEEPIEISKSQIHVEINEARSAVPELLLGALLDAVVRGIHEMTRKTMPDVPCEFDVLPTPPQHTIAMQAPYT